MATTTSGSPNIASFDIKIVGDTCAGKFYIDASPTIYIGSGSLAVLGVNIQVTNPLGVVIKNFSTSGYDIEGGSPPMQDEVEVNIPTEAGNYQYGAYSVLATIYDEDGTEYSITKTITISIPNPKNKTKKYGIATATIKGLCKDGKVVIQVNTPANYRGKIVESVEQEFTLTYPGGSDEDDLVTEQSAFSTTLYEGEYKIVGEICALYNFGDNVYAKVLYKLNYTKAIHCILNYECIGIQLSGYFDKLNTDCTDDENKETNELILKIVGLTKTIEFLSDYNQDASDYIAQLDDLLGCSCTCDDMTGVPIVNNSPAKDFLIEGCNVTKETVGLTDNYTIENYEYTVSINDNNVLTLGTPTLEDCVVTIPLNFDAALLIESIQNNISARNGLSPAIDGDTKYIELGGALTKNTEISGDFDLALSEGKFLVGTVTDDIGAKTYIREDNSDNSYALVAYKNTEQQLSGAFLAILNIAKGLTLIQQSGLSAIGGVVKLVQPENMVLYPDSNTPLAAIGALMQVFGGGNISNNILAGIVAGLEVGNSPDIESFAGVLVTGLKNVDQVDVAAYTGNLGEYHGVLIKDLTTALAATSVNYIYGIRQQGPDDPNILVGKTKIGSDTVAAEQLEVEGNIKYTGKSIVPIQTLTGTTPTWNLNNGEEATWTLSGNSTLAISNAVGVCYGALTIINTSGTSTLALPAGSKVGNFGAGVIDVTGAAGCLHVLCFRYDGSRFTWKKDKNYT